MSKTISNRDTTLTTGIFNLTKAAVGVGTLLIATEFKKTGLGLGAILLTIAAFLTASTLYFLGRISLNLDCNSYFHIGKLAFGSFGEYSAIAALILFLIGALTYYAFIIGKFLSGSIVFLFNLKANESWYTDPRILTIIAGTLLILPLSCLKDMSKLGKTSIAGMVGMIYVTTLTVVDYFYDSATSKNAVFTYFKPDLKECVSTFGTFLFAYSNHFTMVSLMPVLVDPTPARRMQLVCFSSLFSTLIYMCIGVFGYMHFGESVGQILESPSVPTTPYIIAQAIVALVCVFSFPLLLDPVRASIEQILKAMSGNSFSFKNMTTTRHYILSFGITAFCIAIAASFPDLVLSILSVFNSLCGSLLLFIFPALYFLKLKKNYHISSIEKCIAYVDIVFGSVIAVYGTYGDVVKMCADVQKIIKG